LHKSFSESFIVTSSVNSIILFRIHKSRFIKRNSKEKERFNLKMAFRNNNNNNRRNNQGMNFNNNNNYGGTISRGNVNPWDGPSMGNNNMGRGNDALALANNLLNNLLRNQNQNNVPPSLLDMAGPRGNYNDCPRIYNDFRMNRGNGGRMPNNNRRNNNRVVKGAIRKPNVGNRKPNAQKNFNNSKQNDSVTEQTTNKKNDNARNVHEIKDEAIPVKEPKRKNSPYSDVPNDMFYCHLCAKHMWDSTSFENHLKGRTHQMMKEGVEESYRLRANMLRQEAKIAEQLKSIEIDRLKRLGKAIRAANQIREYCAMCDLQFYGHLSTHRKSEGHLDLKKFLHPKCEDCSTEFHNRTEFDDHLLSPGHMKTSKTPPSYKSEESRKNRLHILTEIDETRGLREEKPKKEKSKDVTSQETETEALTDDGESKTVQETEKMETEVSAADNEVKQEDDVDDNENQNDHQEFEPILDYIEGDEIGPEIENKIPKYNFKRQVGFSLISKLVCFECRLCNKYFDNELTAEVHSRTYNHHRLFVKFLNEKANETKIAQKRAAAAAEETERLKRIKLETNEEVVNKSDLYDPTEATGEEESKDTEMIENILGKTEKQDFA
ncbi:CLUMA_CG000066, isoform A, partial [Clunio marinus]